MKTLKQYYVVNILILFVGIGLIVTGLVLVSDQSILFLSLISGFVGVTLTFISVNLLVDLNEIRKLQKH
jgi:hypothetical protein